MPSISPSSASIAINGSQALVSTDVPSPKWYIVSGLGSLSGVSGSNATYDAPSAPTVAKVRAAENYWTITYDPNSRLTVDGSNVLNLASSGPGYANGKQSILVAGCGFKWTVPTGFAHVSDTSHSVGLAEGVTGQTFLLDRTGGLTGKGNVGVADGDVFEWLLDGTKTILVKKNGTLVATYADVATWAFGTYAPGAFIFHVRNVNFSGGSTLYVPAPLEVGAKSNFLNWICVEAEITVTAPLDASFTLGATSYNYGETVSATDTSSGGAGTKTRVWKIDGVTTVPSNGNYTSPTFAGLSAGNHTIRLDITDDSGTDFFEATVFIGTVSGSASVANSATATYTTNVTSPTWSVLSGSGSINSSTGVFTAPSSGSGQSTIRAINGANFATKILIWGFPRIVALGDVTTYTSTGLLSSTSYRARVVALDAEGNESEPSNWVTATTD